MNKIGFEKEYILRNSKNELVIDPSRYGYETDNFGVLVEIRGAPKETVQEALADILSKEITAKAKALRHNFTLCEEPTVKLSDEEILKVTDRYHDMLHDKVMEAKRHKNTKVVESFKISELTAGLHIHFSKEETKDITTTSIVNNTTIIVPRNAPLVKETITNKNETQTKVVINTFIDMPKIISTLDKEFTKEITATGRVFGSYEMKQYGFEYRSLPNNINFEALSKVLINLNW